MSLQTKRQMENSRHNGFGTFGVIIMVITATIVFGATVPVSDAMVAHSAKASLKLLKTSSSSLLVHQSPMSRQHRRLHKRETPDGSYNDPIEDDSQYDDNYEVVPLMPGDSPKTVGEHLSEKAKEVAESFSQMWQSVTDSVKRCVESLRQFFSDDGEDLPLTPEEEEARGKAIEEQYELFRHAYENQI